MYNLLISREIKIENVGQSSKALSVGDALVLTFED